MRSQLSLRSRDLSVPNRTTGKPSARGLGAAEGERNPHSRWIESAQGTNRAGPRRRPEPDSVADLTARSWKFILKKTLREFSKDQCLDLAAALTYYAVLALFPALLALVSNLGLIGQGQKSTQALLDITPRPGTRSCRHR